MYLGNSWRLSCHPSVLLYPTSVLASSLLKTLTLPGNQSLGDGSAALCFQIQVLGCFCVQSLLIHLPWLSALKGRTFGKASNRQLCCGWLKGLWEDPPCKKCGGDGMSCPGRKCGLFGTNILNGRLAFGSGHIGSCELSHDHHQRYTSKTELLC